MRKLVMLCACISLVFSSCSDNGEGTYYEYIVRNQSDMKIKVEAYVRSNKDIPPEITLLYPGDILRKEKTVPLPPHTPGLSFGRLFGNGEYKDSLKIIFYGKTMTKVRYCVDTCNNKYNPLNICLYGGEEETFIFTEEHFENAKPCTDCE